MAAGRRVRIYVDGRVPLDQVARLANGLGAVLVADQEGNVVLMRRQDYLDRLRRRHGVLVGAPAPEDEPPPEAA